GLEAVVLRSLRRERGERYATARDLGRAIDGFARSRDLPLSVLAFSDYLRELFAPEMEAWSAAERAGISLVDYVTTDVGRKTASIESAKTNAFAASRASGRPMPLSRRGALRRVMLLGGGAAMLAAVATAA